LLAGFRLRGDVCSVDGKAMKWLTRVMISMKRQKAKKIPKSILSVLLLVRDEG
jgi:hypothetical protein